MDNGAVILLMVIYHCVILIAHINNVDYNWAKCCRLRDYDRNFNFGASSGAATMEHKMQLPDPSSYKDINATSQVYCCSYL